MMCRLESMTTSMPAPPSNSGDPESTRSMGLITGGTGSLGCLVASWLTHEDTQMSAAPHSTPKQSSHATLGPEAQVNAPTGGRVELLGRSGRASNVQPLLKCIAHGRSMVAIRQCDASCAADVAAAFRLSPQVCVSVLMSPPHHYS